MSKNSNSYIGIDATFPVVLSFASPLMSVLMCFSVFPALAAARIAVRFSHISASMIPLHLHMQRASLPTFGPGNNEGIADFHKRRCTTCSKLFPDPLQLCKGCQHFASLGFVKDTIVNLRLSAIDMWSSIGEQCLFCHMRCTWVCMSSGRMSQRQSHD